MWKRGCLALHGCYVAVTDGAAPCDNNVQCYHTRLDVLRFMKATMVNKRRKLSEYEVKPNGVHLTSAFFPP